MVENALWFDSKGQGESDGGNENNGEQETASGERLWTVTSVELWNETRSFAVVMVRWTQMERVKENCSTEDLRTSLDAILVLSYPGRGLRTGFPGSAVR